MEEQVFRNKIHWLSFLFSILVIWVHSFNGELFLGAGESAARVMELEGRLGNGLGQIAVPGFFMVSAYLFYRNFSMDKLYNKWKSRLKTVAVPYLLWNFLYYMGYVAATRLPGAAGIVGKEPVPFGAETMFEALFHYAYNPVFWYLYQLILLIVLAPVLYAILKCTWTGGIFLVLLLCFLRGNRDLPLLNADALFYYSAAAFGALHRESWGGFVEKELKGWEAAVRALLLAGGFAAVYVMGRPGGVLFCRALYTVALRFLGVWAAIFAVKLLPLPTAREWMKHSFFLYAIHFAWVRLINKAAAVLFPGSEVIALTVFILMPAFMAAVSTLIGNAMRRFLPGVYYVLSGGR